MLTSEVQPDGDGELVVSGLEPSEVQALREWFCYTKPIGPSLRVVVPITPGGHAGFRVVAAGNEPGSSEKIPEAAELPQVIRGA